MDGSLDGTLKLKSRIAKAIGNSLPLLALACAISFAPAASAAASTSSTSSASPHFSTTLQSGRGGGFRHPNPKNAGKSSIDARVERIAKQLNLNDVQRFDLKKLLEGQQAEANRLWNDQQIDPIARMTKLRTLHDDTQKQFHALLTEEQRKKYDDLLQKASNQNSQQPQADDKKVH